MGKLRLDEQDSIILFSILFLLFLLPKSIKMLMVVFMLWIVKNCADYLIRGFNDG
jgi:hypothetical protein